METELRAHGNLTVLLINREVLYVIIASPVVSILGCACVLAYSFTNSSRLKRNAGEVRNSGGARVAADKESKQPSAADDASMGDAFSSTVSLKDLADAGTAISMDLGRLRAVDGKGSDVSSAGRSADDTSPVLARQEACGEATRELQDGVGNGDVSPAVSGCRDGLLRHDNQRE